ncbi:MAG: hypothetical protein MUO91_09880 [candidate division Zixibacteria bacterium]|jgi:hypothetical protein|nr:hypothetical protein [candidate division Zixibacteria bacterium]
MKKVFLILILIFCLVLPLNAVREDEPHDAYWWEMSSDSYKLGYISGYVNGMSLILQRLSGFQMPDSLYLKYSKSPDKYWTANWAYSIIFWDHELYELT